MRREFGSVVMLLLVACSCARNHPPPAPKPAPASTVNGTERVPLTLPDDPVYIRDSSTADELRIVSRGALSSAEAASARPVTKAEVKSPGPVTDEKCECLRCRGHCEDDGNCYLDICYCCPKD